MRFADARRFADAFPPQQVSFHEPLARYTTFGIGGPADVLVKALVLEDLRKAVDLARALQVRFLVLGGGSNVLIRDRGFRGVVVLNRTSRTSFHPDAPPSAPAAAGAPDFPPRGGAIRGVKNDAPDPCAVVCADSGASLQALIKASLARNYLGLEHFAGIPGTVGGALYNNAHFSGRQIGERIVAVEYLDSRGKSVIAPPQQLHFRYDNSDFRRHPDWVATRVFFALTPGDGEQGRQRYREILKARRDYPGRSAGCVFANLSVHQQRKARLPSRSVGWINDRMLGIRGLRRGGAVLGTGHANFIANEGNASSDDVLQLIRTVRQMYRDRFGLRLRLEIRVV